MLQITRFWLWWIRLLRPLWQKLGVNQAQLLAIMEAKLIMDSRRASVNSFRGGDNGSGKGREIFKYVLLVAFGSIMLFAFYFLEVFTTALMVYFTIWVVYLALLLVTDFTEVLINTKDNFILLPRPVDGRTLLLSRLLHIFIYLSSITLAYTTPVAIYLLVSYGLLAWLVFAVLVLLSVFLTIFLVNLVYILLLKYTTPQQFKDSIGYIQIAFSIAIFGGYILLPEMVDMGVIQTIDVLEYRAAWLLPTTWFTGVWELIVWGRGGVSVLLRAGLALVFPLFCLWLVVSVLAQRFNHRLLSIGESSGTKKSAVKKSSSPPPLSQWLSRLFCWDQVERAAFAWSWALTARSRSYKVKVYPGFGFVPVYFLYFVFKPSEDGGLMEHMYVFLAYMGILIIINGFVYTKYSDQEEGIWVLHTGPYATLGKVMVGNFKSVIAKFFLPFALFTLVFTWMIWGLDTTDDLLLAFVNSLLVGSLILRFSKHWPFSVSWKESEKGGGVMTNFLLLLAGGVLAGVHYVLVGHPIWVLGCAFLAALLFYWNIRTVSLIR